MSGSVGLQIPPGERALARVLLVEPETDVQETLRDALRAIGYTNVQVAANHMDAFKCVGETHVTHLIFSSAECEMSACEFLARIIQLNSAVIAIATSYQPARDEVFELLRIGARGFLQKPFSNDALEQSLLSATKGQPLSRAMLDARDRNEALVALVAASLDKVADNERLARDLGHGLYQSALDRARLDLHSALRLAETFAEGGSDAFFKRFVDFLSALGAGPATRLGRLRKRLADQRGVKAHA